MRKFIIFRSLFAHGHMHRLFKGTDDPLSRDHKPAASTLDQTGQRARAAFARAERLELRTHAE